MAGPQSDRADVNSMLIPFRPGARNNDARRSRTERDGDANVSASLFTGLSLMEAQPSAQPAAVDQSPPAADAPSVQLMLPAWGSPSLASHRDRCAVDAREEQGWFRVGVPAGWQLLADRASGRVVLSNPDRRGLHLWMLLVPRAVSGQAGTPVLAAGRAGRAAERGGRSRPSSRSANARPSRRKRGTASSPVRPGCRSSRPTR